MGKETKNETASKPPKKLLNKETAKHTRKQKIAGRRTAAQAEREAAAPSGNTNSFAKNLHDASHSLGQIHEQKGKHNILETDRSSENTRHTSKHKDAGRRTAAQEESANKRRPAESKTALQALAWFRPLRGRKPRISKKTCSTSRPISTPENKRSLGEEPPRKQSAKKRRPAETPTASQTNT